MLPTGRSNLLLDTHFLPMEHMRLTMWSMVCTVLSRASDLGRSQFQLLKTGVGPYTENLLERLNYLLESAHPTLLRQSHNLQVYTE